MLLRHDRRRVSLIGATWPAWSRSCASGDDGGGGFDAVSVHHWIVGGLPLVGVGGGQLRVGFGSGGPPHGGCVWRATWLGYR